MVRLNRQYPENKTGLNGEGNAEILNLKGEPEMVSLLRQDPNILPAYLPYEQNPLVYYCIR